MAFGDTQAIAKLLCNRSVCWLSEKVTDLALFDATAAVLIAPATTKPWYRRAQALQKLKMHCAAIESCRRGAATLEADDTAGRKSFERLECLIQRQLDAGPSPSTTSGPSTAEMLQQRRAHQGTMHGPDAGAGGKSEMALKMMRMMSGRLPPEAQDKFFGASDKRLIEFHVEFPKHFGWPAGVDTAQAARYLERMFEKHAVLPHMMISAWEVVDSPFQAEDVVKRLNGDHKLLWYSGVDRNHRPIPVTSARWAIFDREVELPEIRQVYGGGRVTHSFTNQAYRQEILTTGKVHVAVGFVDLGVLLVAKLDPAAAGPLRFIGYDLSAYAVAKTAVIWEMALRSHDPKYAMVQVWFSATWSKRTMGIFASAAAVCAARQHKSTEVGTLLRHWSTSPGVEIRTARKMWFGKMDERSARSAVHHHLLRADRAAQIAYELTGDFGLSPETAAVGSVVMFDNPDTTAPLDDDESVLATAALADVLQIAEETGCTVIAALEHLHLKNCQKIASWAKQNQVVVELRHEAVEYDHFDIFSSFSSGPFFLSSPPHLFKISLLRTP